MPGFCLLTLRAGSTLQLTGRARIIWDAHRVAEFAGAERMIEFDIDEVVELTGVQSRCVGDSSNSRRSMLASEHFDLCSKDEPRT